jgi:hypothetical protein
MMANDRPDPLVERAIQDGDHHDLNAFQRDAEAIFRRDHNDPAKLKHDATLLKPHDTNGILPKLHFPDAETVPVSTTPAHDGKPTPQAIAASAREQDPTIIRDCSQGPCLVKGHNYTDNFAIPGNERVPLYHPDRRPVLDPSGKQVYQPSRASLDSLAAQARSEAASNAMTQTPILVSLAGPIAGLAGPVMAPTEVLAKFMHNGPWDFQRLRSDDSRTIFTNDYKDFSNIAIGYVGASLGIDPSKITYISDQYCQATHCHFREPMAKPPYSHLPARDVADFAIGYNLWIERHSIPSS